MSETLQPALPDELDAYAERLMKALCARDLMVATAESCTGGMLAALLTDIDGAGHGFDRGFVTYDARSKQDLFGLTAEMTERNQAVTAAVARAMAEGALQNSNADIALSVTGFAGPTPHGEEGLVHFGCARPGKPTLLREEHFGSCGRGPIRIAALRVLLEMLQTAIDESKPEESENG